MSPSPSPDAKGPKLEPLPLHLVDDAVRRALREDLGDAGDVTSGAVIPCETHARGRIVARAAGRLAGLDLATHAFRLLDPECRIAVSRRDGENVAGGETIAAVEGRARALLAAERVALNFLGHLSGIATATAAYVHATQEHKARISCTRKTTPGLRALEKYAVRAGGGVNHRFGLYDGILIKDNHIAAAGGVSAALKAARANAGHMVKIEIEIETLDQLDEALTVGVDAVLLDNMSLADLKEAVRRVSGRAHIEASGGVSLDNVAAIAATGVDLISVGRITHSAPALDLALDFGIA